MDSFGIYIHVPYCRTICPYCDFNVHARKEYPWTQLALSVGREMKRRASLFEQSPLGTIYFGGGTPSLAPPSFFAGVIKGIGERFELQDELEITVEANPGTIGTEVFEQWREAGINRVSLGWQSTHQRLMNILGRDHSVEESMAAFVDARNAGFDNISLDLIFGVPGQKPQELAHDLETITELGPDHVSIYEMTFHEGTPYARYLEKGRFKSASDETIVSMTLQIEDAMDKAGYEHYEVSNFCRPGKG